VLGYFAIKAYWRWHVVNRWRLRREWFKRKAHSTFISNWSY